MRACVASLLVCVLGACGACGPVGPRDVDRPAPTTALGLLRADGAARLVAVERGPGDGSRLVLIDEEGLRQRALTELPGGKVPVFDFMPAWSPDGRWVVFASTREGGDMKKAWSLWIVPAIDDGEPRRLTDGGDDVLEGWPCWTPDGKSVVFARRAGAGRADLWRLALVDSAHGPTATGEPQQLTDDAGDEIEPAVSPGGKWVAFTAIDGDGGKRIAMMRLDGSERKPFSAGPRDEAPTWSPDGKRLAFVAPADGRSDLDVFVVDVAGGERHVVVDDPHADEGAPRFSADGHVLLATSKVRDASGRLLVAMIVAADLDDDVPVWRGLVERLPVPRLGVSPAPVPLDRKALRRAPSYEKALDRSVPGP